MTLRWTETLLMLFLMILAVQDTWMLPGPMSAWMESVNMKHKLHWTPLQAACNTTVLYSVQYQGEFERLLRNGSWVEAAECQRVPQTHCDLTFDLGSDSDYDVRVRARCGAWLSAWTKLSQPFNRKNTILTVPKMRVMTAGDSLHVSFKELPLTATVNVIIWKKGDELQPAVYQMPAEQTVLPVAALQEGAVYCVTAQVVLDSGRRSDNTDPDCRHITGPEAAAWKRPTTVVLTILFTAGFLFALFWCVLHFNADVWLGFCQEETLPKSLQRDNWDIKVQVRREDEEERLDVPSILPVPQTWSSSGSPALLGDHK